MTLVSPTQAGGLAEASDVNTPTGELAAVINGQLQDDNVADDAAIASSKIAFNSTPGLIVQQPSTNYATQATGTGTIPLDDTIPQNTEGDEYMSQAITPKFATSTLIIEVTIMLSNSAVTQHMTVALFQDSTANALAAVDHYMASADGPATIRFAHKMTAGSTSATTFKVRAGANGAGTTTFCGRSAARLYGAITKSSIKVTETLA